MKTNNHPARKIITLLTDFGLKDPYVGILKGVILAVTGAHACPVEDGTTPSAGETTPVNPSWLKNDYDVAIVDITHDIEPQDIREAAFLIEEYCCFFPVGTIHVAIVDPTVGSARRPIILSKDNYLFVGPDNGIFTLIMGDDPEVYLIENSVFMLQEVSSTFHGRDIFAPAAAYLLKGCQFSDFGKRITDPVRLHDLLPVTEGNFLKGEVVRFDRFGNAITNIKVDYLRNFILGHSFEIHVAGRTFKAVNKSYYEDTFTCLVGSFGYLEFGYYKGSFAETTKIKKGEQVIVERGLVLQGSS